jgi:hypothetical protein
LWPSGARCSRARCVARGRGLPSAGRGSADPQPSS